MALSNLERQKRYQARLKAQAAAGVTPDDVHRAGRAIIDSIHAQGDPDFEWTQWRGIAATKRGRDHWPDLFRWLKPDDIDDGEYGDDTDLVRRVAAVAAAMRTLPDE